MSPSSASPTGIPTRACSNCSTPWPRCPAGDATLHLAGRDDVDADYSDRVAPAPGRARSRRACRGARRGRPRRRSPSCTPAPTSSCCPATSRATRPCSPRRCAAGLPVVGWRRPFLEHFATTASRDASSSRATFAALSAALARLATDDDDRRRLAAAARRRGSTLPTWDDTAARFFAALRAAAAAVEPADDGSASTRCRCG